jgi:hypothetical protein
MRIFSHSDLLIAFLVISLVQPPLLAQKKVPSRQAVKRSIAQKTQIADAVMAEISEMTPLPPASAEASEAESKPPAELKLTGRICLKLLWSLFAISRIKPSA